MRTGLATVRVRSGKYRLPTVPSPKRKEYLGRLLPTNATDLNEAIGVASKWPSARLGSIEVRPIEAALPADRRYAYGKKKSKHYRYSEAAHEVESSLQVQIVVSGPYLIDV